MWKFGRNLPLATFGSERVNMHSQKLRGYPLGLQKRDHKCFQARLEEDCPWAFEGEIFQSQIKQSHEKISR